MTKKAFKHDMQRGLGSCVLALKNMSETEKEKMKPLVLWGCSRDMAFDAQCEGCRSVYLYELIVQFPDETPFVDGIKKRLFGRVHSAGWEFQQNCELLAHFVAGGSRRAWRILGICYDYLLEMLDECEPDQYGRFPERDNFQVLCVTLVSLCFADRKRRAWIFRKIVGDLCELAEGNPLLTVDHFDWFQQVSEDSLGKTAMHKLLYGSNVDAYIKTYVQLLEKCQTMRAEWRKEKREEPETADALYRLLKAGKRPGKEWPLMLAYRWMRENKEEQVLRLAAYYRDEKEWEIRFALLRMLAKKDCAWALDLPQLLADSRSEHSDLAEQAFTGLGYRKDTGVRAYALELLQNGKHMTEAISMLAKNYEVCDRTVLINAVKRIPVIYWDTGWHWAFGDILDLFREPGRGKPNELLFYMYRNTLCSCCREHIVREMGRRRMLTRGLLEEMQYDCNEKIRKYAVRKLSRMGDLTEKLN